MLEVFSTRGASLHQINSLAEWVRDKIANISDGKFDVIKFVELDLPVFFPGLYLEIEADLFMGRRKAYLSSDSLGIVVSESVYNRASEGCLIAAESILHEVGHLFLHDKYKCLGLNDGHGPYQEQIKNTNPSNSAEWQAKNFAICVLFPYSRFKNTRDRVELQVYFDLNVAQANRIIEHIKKLRSRERDQNQKADRLWMRSVVRRLVPDINERVHNAKDQFELFYRPPAIDTVHPLSVT